MSPRLWDSNEEVSPGNGPSGPEGSSDEPTKSPERRRRKGRRSSEPEPAGKSSRGAAKPQRKGRWKPEYRDDAEHEERDDRDDDAANDESWGDDDHQGDDWHDDDWDEDDWDEDDDDCDRPRILRRSDHPVSRSLVSPGALKVLYRLKKMGYRAYLCGGAVRDLMLGRKPKDFDVATDARPNEIKRAFRNARIIGRRFRLAHIIFYDEIVEVSTFRRTPDPDDQAGGPEDKLITNDNAYGSPLEDAFRRDFTINALFYNIEDFSVVDYCHGIHDLEEGLIRVIGDPDLRFKEDPVRMLRACEFAGRLDFEIEVDTQDGIYRSRHELRKAAPARLIEELLQLLKCGHVSASMQWMLDLGVLEVILPEALDMIKAQEKGAGSLTGIFPVLDEIIQEEKRELPDSVLLGAIMLPRVMLRRFDYEQRQGKPMGSTQFRKAVDDALSSFTERFSLAKHKRAMLVHSLDGFHRLVSQSWTPAQRARFASKSYFDDALSLLELLVRATGEGHETLEHWQAAKRQRRRQPEPHVEKKRRSRRRRGRR